MIQLTKNDGKKVWFNINHITAVCENDKTRDTLVYTTDCTGSTYWLIKESPTSVVELIEEEERGRVSAVFS